MSSIGMAFGRHVISPNAPFTEGIPYDDEDVLKAIVLLTDGRLRTPGVQMALTIGERGRSTWNHVRLSRKEEVMVIMVAFDLRDRDAKERLQNCATSLSHYFDASSNSDLAAAFDAITGNSCKIYI